jgi:hypothetical protein
MISPFVLAIMFLELLNGRTVRVPFFNPCISLCPCYSWSPGIQYLPGLCRQNPDCRAGDFSGNPPEGGGIEAIAIKKTNFSLMIPSLKSQSQCRGSGSV